MLPGGLKRPLPANSLKTKATAAITTDITATIVITIVITIVVTIVITTMKFSIFPPITTQRVPNEINISGIQEMWNVTVAEPPFFLQN